MSRLTVISFADEQAGRATFEDLKNQRKAATINLEDFAFVTRDDKNKVKLEQGHAQVGKDTAWGTGIGALVGMLFAVPWLGAAAGAAAGALTGKLKDLGINDDTMKQLGEQIQPGSGALFIMGNEQEVDKIIPECIKAGGVVTKSELVEDAKEKIDEEAKKREAAGATPPTTKVAASAPPTAKAAAPSAPPKPAAKPRPDASSSAPPPV